MSAWVVAKEHIDVILFSARGVGGRAFSWRDSEDVHFFNDAPDDLARLGDSLLQENVRSVRFRYARHPDLDEMIPSWAKEPYAYADPGFLPSAVEALKALDCLEYQSCEHPEWEGSEAKAFSDALRRLLITQLPGYDEAPWVWGEAEIAARRERGTPT